MNVLEMHLAIQQGVDKINSLQADMLLPEEIDLELNKAQMKFISTKYGRNNLLGKGFEQSQKRIDDLRTLLSEYEAPVSYKDQLDANTWIDTFRLPNDYMYLVSQRSDVKIDNCKDVSWSLQNSSAIHYFAIGLDEFVCNNVNNNSTDFIAAMSMMADPDNPVLGDQLIWANTSGFSYPADIENVRLDILNISVPGVEVFWEQFGNLIVPGHFIFVMDTVNFYPWFNWDMSVTNSTSGSNLQTVMVGANGIGTIAVTAYAQYEDSTYGAKRDIAEGTTVSSVNKFIQHDDIFTLLKDPFNTTKYTSPLTTIRGSYIDIYTSAIFIIDKVKIVYIRIPAEISLNLAVSCELPDHSHQEIVDMTISSILEGTSDPRYKSQQVELSKNE